MTFTRVIIGLLAFVLTLTAAPIVHAQSALEAQTKQDEAELKGLEGEKLGIQDRLGQIEKNVATVNAKKAEIEGQIKRLGEEAAKLLPELEAKNREYKAKQQTLSKAMVFDYKTPRRNGVLLLAEEGSISTSLNKFTYVGSVERQLEDLTRDAEQARDDMDAKKRELDLKKSGQAVARLQLKSLEASLAQQNLEQRELLANKSNEAAYLAEKIKRSREVQEQILKGGNAIWGTFSNGARVKQGDAIGFEGSTGFSTGCHTHFSVIEGNRWTNPEAFWNVLRKPDGKLMQAFGMTEFAQSGAYGGDIHNGLDVAQGCGKPVRAAADGTIIRDNRTDGSGFGHYVMIRHDNGLITLYGHMI